MLNVPQKKNEDPNTTGLTIKLVSDLQFGMAQSSYFKSVLSQVIERYISSLLITKLHVSFKEKTYLFIKHTVQRFMSYYGTYGCLVKDSAVLILFCWFFVSAGSHTEP